MWDKKKQLILGQVKELLELDEGGVSELT